MRVVTEKVRMKPQWMHLRLQVHWDVVSMSLKKPEAPYSFKKLEGLSKRICRLAGSLAHFVERTRDPSTEQESITSEGAVISVVDLVLIVGPLNRA